MQRHRDVGLIPGQEDLSRRKWQPTPNPEKSHGQRTLAGYNLQGCEELTEHACMHMCWTKCLCFPKFMKVKVLITQLSPDSLGSPGSSVHGFSGMNVGVGELIHSSGDLAAQDQAWVTL